MPVDWMSVTDLSFNSLLLLERVQLSWFPGWVPESELAVALRANPTVEWYFRHKCPEIGPWIDRVVSRSGEREQVSVREAEESVMSVINDLLVYVVDPAIYDRQPFLSWDSRELTELAGFEDRIVVDVGSGTGRLAFAVADVATAVYAVEPVGNLRSYIAAKAKNAGCRNVFPIDGLITSLPFHDGFADITMGGHVFGEIPDREIDEVLRITRRGGTVIACPGNNDVDDATHAAFVDGGFEWARFVEPRDGVKRKYWRTR